jgi:DNA-binding beta-propeller fold protein YncE
MRTAMHRPRHWRSLTLAGLLLGMVAGGHFLTGSLLAVGQTAAAAPAKPAAPQTATAAAPRPASAQGRKPALKRPIMVVDRPPVRVLEDANPTFNAIALNPAAKEVFISNNNKASTPSVLVYPTQFRQTDRVMEPRRRLAGTNSRLGDFCGMAVSPESREIYTVQGEDTEMKVFPIDGSGDLSASRSLTIAHGAAGVYLDSQHDELYITTEHINKVTVYRRGAEGDEKPLRYIQGPHTNIADPHGLYVDPKTDELFVSNYGNFRETNENDDTESSANEDAGGERIRDKAAGVKKPKPPRKVLPLRPSTGKFVPPFIAVYSRTATGDAAPIRVIQGPQTGLNLPLGIARDRNGDIIVANSGDDSVLFFAADARGDVAPKRVLRGAKANLKAPTGVALDPTRNELWVTSWGNHLTSVFNDLVNGDTAPLRFIRSASKDAPEATFGTPGAIAWDPVRKQILVPN